MMEIEPPNFTLKRLGPFHITDMILGKGSFAEVRLGFHTSSSTPLAVKIIRIPQKENSSLNVVKENKDKKIGENELEENQNNESKNQNQCDNKEKLSILLEKQKEICDKFKDERDSSFQNNKNFYDFRLPSEIIREIKILRKISHKNIVKLIDLHTTPNHIYLFFEFCNGPTLSEYISNHNGALTVEKSIEILGKIASALYTLNLSSIVHRDIKPENILFHNGVLKIVDFGFARILEHTDPNYYTFLGTPAYMSPQILFQQKYSEKCDVWSGGVLFFKLLTGNHPFFFENSPLNYMELCKLYKNGPKLFLLGEKEALKSLIGKMLEFEEKDRLSWAEVLEELKEFGFKKEENEDNITIMKIEEEAREEKRQEGEVGRKIKNKLGEGQHEKEEEEEKEWEEVRKELERGKRVGGLYKRVAKSFYELRKCEHIKLEENMNMIIFYLLLNQGYLFLKENQVKLDHPSYFSSKFSIKSDQIINFNNFLKDLREKNKIEIHKSLSILKEIEVKIKNKVSKCGNMLSFLKNFTLMLEKGCLEDWATSQGVLKEIIRDFEGFYMRDLEGLDERMSKVLFMLKRITIGCDFRLLYDNLEDYERSLEGIENKGKDELIVLIRNEG